MVYLTRPIKRISSAVIHEAGKIREVVVIIRPHGVIGFRAKGCRKEYQITADILYTMAVKASVAAVERLKKKKGRAVKGNTSKDAKTK